MDIDAISGVIEPAVVHLAPPHEALSVSEVALADAHARAAETDEQLAAGGDPLAADRVEQAEERATPVRSQGLQPALPDHPVGPAEVGKGLLIDVYD